jgi:hypothetical protein
MREALKFMVVGAVGVAIGYVAGVLRAGRG